MHFSMTQTLIKKLFVFAFQVLVHECRTLIWMDLRTQFFETVENSNQNILAKAISVEDMTALTKLIPSLYD